MKIEFFESVHGTSFDLKPETPEETAALARIAKSSRSEKPSINFYFSKEPTLSIWIRKVNEKKQINCLSNKR